MGHGDADAPQRLDPLRDRVHPLALLVVVLVEEQVERIERRHADLPVVLLMAVPQGHRVGQHLIEILDAFLAGVFRQRDWHFDDVPVRLDLRRMLTDEWFGSPQDDISFNRFGHGYSPTGAFINRSTVDIGL